MENTDYDLEAIYDEQIYPLMEQIITICQEHRIPLVCSFQYGTHDANTDDEDRGLCTTYSAHGRKCPELTRAKDIIVKGLPAENRLMAFRVTKGPNV
jgi:hypothetical protein